MILWNPLEWGRALSCAPGSSLTHSPHKQLLCLGSSRLSRLLEEFRCYFFPQKSRIGLDYIGDRLLNTIKHRSDDFDGFPLAGATRKLLSQSDFFLALINIVLVH